MAALSPGEDNGCVVYMRGNGYVVTLSVQWLRCNYDRAKATLSQ